MLEYQCRPIVEWPGKLTANRKRATFRADYGDTMKLLDRELRHLNGRGVALLMALNEDEIRLDGRPYANARPRHPGVILTFTSRASSSSPGTPMRFPCDAFDHWQDNLRAIALALEALRKVDRYGVTKRGEQYTGWKALPPPGSTVVAPNGSTWTKEIAKEFLRRIIGGRVDTLAIDAAIRECEQLTHPDHGGNVEDFKRVQEARRLLVS